MSALQQFITDKTPDGWTTRPFWSLFQRVKFTGFPDEELLSVYRDYGVIPKSSRDDNHNKASEDLSNYQLVDKGWLVTNKMKAWQGSIAISRHRGIVSPAYYAYKPLSQEHDQFLHYLLRSSNYIALYGRISKGVRVNQWDLEHEALRNIPVLLPSYETQKEIADFLDRETARIDQLIEKKISFKNILHVRLLSIIHENICGFDTSEDLIATENPWIGKLNSNFKIFRLKQLIEFINGYAFDSADLSEQGVPVLRIGDVKPEFDLDGAQKYSGSLNQLQLKKFAAKKNDILIAMTGGTIGKTSIYKTDNLAYINQRVGIMRAKKINVDYLRAFLISGIFTEQINLLAFGGAQPNISSTDICNIFIPIPSENVQEVIGSRLRKAIDEASVMNGLIDKSVEGLMSLKSSLITEAVTGQLDIQKWQQRGMTDSRLDKIEEDMEQSKRASA